MSYTPPNQNGQATSANSSPVVLSTEQQAILTNSTQKTQIADSDGTAVDVIALSTQLVGTDKGIVTHSVIHGQTTAGGGTYVDVKVTPSGALSIDNSERGVTSTNNTSITPLNASSTFTGTSDLNDFPDVLVVCKTDQAGTLFFDFSVNGTNWETFPNGGFSVVENIQEVHKAIKGNRYFRVRFTNTSVSNQTFLRLYTYYGEFGQLNSPLDSVPSTDSDATNVKAVLVAQNDSGNYQFIGCNEKGNLKVAVENPKTAFNELSVAENTPVAQISFEYGLNTQLTTTTLTGSGTATTTSSNLVLSTTANASSSAQVVSRRYLKYRGGQGAVGRGTMIFTAGATGSNQYAGIGTPDMQNGYFFGYQDTTFGIFHINNGSTTFIAQTSWNVDKLDGSLSTSNPSGMVLNQTLGNVFQIKYQYLGYGVIYFYIEHDTDGEFTLVHIIRYPNSATIPSLRNPSLGLLWRVENTSNTSDIVLKAGSGALFVEGKILTLGAKYGTDNNKSGIATLTNILTLRNATTYNTVANRGQIRLKGVSVAYDGVNNGIATLQIILNAVLGGTPSFTTIAGTTGDNGVTITAGNSVTSVDVAGTTITNGTIVFNTILARNAHQYIDLSDLDIFLSPTETLTFAGKATTSGQIGVAVNWVEDL